MLDRLIEFLDKSSDWVIWIFGSIGAGLVCIYRSGVAAGIRSVLRNYVRKDEHEEETILRMNALRNEISCKVAALRSETKDDLGEVKSRLGVIEAEQQHQSRDIIESKHDIKRLLTLLPPDDGKCYGRRKSDGSPIEKNEYE